MKPSHSPRLAGQGYCFVLALLTACGPNVSTHGDASDTHAADIADALAPDVAIDNPLVTDVATDVPASDAGTPCDPGSPIAAVIAGMAPGSWRELPNTPMSAVCPAPYEHYGCEAVMSAWSGGAYDTLHDQLLVFGGGHHDSYYNNVFAFHLSTMTWQRWTELPAGWAGDSHPAVGDDIRVETCGLYPVAASLDIPAAWLTMSGYVQPDRCDDPMIASQLDPQQPRSTHTYGNVAYSPLTDRFYNLGSVALWPSGQSGSSRVMGFDFATSRWVRGANNPQPFFGHSATDARGHIWYLGSANLVEYDPMADVWTPTASPTSGTYTGSVDVDTQRNTLVMTADGMSIDTYAIGQPGAPHAMVASTGLAAPLVRSSGFAYDDALDRFVAWSGGRTLYFLDPATWHFTALAATGDDPGAPAANGTFGRFRYSPRCQVFVGVNSTMSNVFVFKPPVAAP